MRPLWCIHRRNNNIRKPTIFLSHTAVRYINPFVLYGVRHPAAALYDRQNAFLFNVLHKIHNTRVVLFDRVDSYVHDYLVKTKKRKMDTPTSFTRIFWYNTEFFRFSFWERFVIAIRRSFNSTQMYFEHNGADERFVFKKKNIILRFHRAIFSLDPDKSNKTIPNTHCCHWKIWRVKKFSRDFSDR